MEGSPIKNGGAGARNSTNGSFLSGNLVENYFKTTNCVYDLSKPVSLQQPSSPTIRGKNKHRKGGDKHDGQETICGGVVELEASPEHFGAGNILPSNGNCDLKGKIPSQLGSEPEDITRSQEEIAKKSPEKAKPQQTRMGAPGIFSRNIYSQAQSMFNLKRSFGSSPVTRRRGTTHARGEGTDLTDNADSDLNSEEPCEKVYYYYSSDPETDILHADKGLLQGLEPDIQQSGSAQSFFNKAEPKSILRKKDASHSTLTPQRHSHVHFTRNESDANFSHSAPVTSHSTEGSVHFPDQRSDANSTKSECESGVYFTLSESDAPS